MRLVLLLLLLAFFLPLSAYSQGTARPPIPYEDNGACPGECCAYRQWIAKKVTALRADRRSNSPVTLTVRKGERVTAITGVVITTRPGQAKILRPTTIEGMRVRAGDIFYLLTHHGEGWGTVWYKGRFLEMQLFGIPWPGVKYLSEPQSVWWVQIRNRKGQVGWSNQSANFACKDNCGYDCPISGLGTTEQQKPSAVEKSPDRPALTSSLIPTGDVIRIQTKSGVVEVKNFYKTAVSADDNFVFFDTPGDKDYHIQYSRQDSSFVIQLGDYSVEKARKTRVLAEQEFLEKLGGDKQGICKLDVSVLVSRQLVPEVFQAYDYGLSFCPGSQPL